MRRFLSTFILLTAVASSLVISNNFYKQDNSKYSAQKSNGIQKSIDITDADIYQSKRGTVSISLSK